MFSFACWFYRHCVILLQFKYTTILCLSNKELNKDPLKYLEKMVIGHLLSDNNDQRKNEDLKSDSSNDEPMEKSNNMFLHGQLFADRRSAVEVLNAERTFSFLSPGQIKFEIIESCRSYYIFSGKPPEIKY